jgi:hypothetical protein
MRVSIAPFELCQISRCQEVHDELAFGEGLQKFDMVVVDDNPRLRVWR